MSARDVHRQVFSMQSHLASPEENYALISEELDEMVVSEGDRRHIVTLARGIDSERQPANSKYNRMVILHTVRTESLLGRSVKPFQLLNFKTREQVRVRNQAE
jgi:hypothetical protein